MYEEEGGRNMNFEPGDIFRVLLIITVLEIVLFLIFREIVCWYFKINARLDQQRQTNVLLEKLYNEISTKNGNSHPILAAAAVNQTSKPGAVPADRNAAPAPAGIPAAGQNSADPDYERLLAMSLKQLNERGMLALEDHYWSEANAYFSEALNKDPHSGEAHLGLLLSDSRQPDTDTWLDGIKRKYCCEICNNGLEKVEVIKSFDEHVSSMEESYEIRGYITREEIRALYSGIEHTYQSCVKVWTRRMQSFESMVNAKQFRRVVKYTQGSLNQKITNALEEIITYMNRQFETAMEQDNRNLTRISSTAPRLIAEADEKLRAMVLRANSLKEEKKKVRREKITSGVKGTRDQLGSLFRSAEG